MAWWSVCRTASDKIDGFEKGIVCVLEAVATSLLLAANILTHEGEEDVDAAGGVNVLEHRVRAVAKAEEDLRRLTADSSGRRADGSRPPARRVASSVRP